MFRIFNFSGDQDQQISSPNWAKKLGKVIGNLFSDSGSQPVPTIKDKETVTEYQEMGMTLSSMPTLWRVHADRKSTYKDISRMDAEDELVAQALDIIADCTLNFNDPEGFVFEIQGSPKVKKVLDDLINRLDLSAELWQLIRDMVKHGDEFREIIIDRKANNIKALKQTISYQIFPATNDHGDKIPGWLIYTDQAAYNGQGQQLEEWQICRFSFGNRKGVLTDPILNSARRNWARLSKMEDSMTIARLLRAYDKLLHKIPIKPEWEVDKINTVLRNYKDNIQKRKMLASEGLVNQNDNPLDVQTDFYLPDDGTGRGGVEILSANNLQLINLNDIYYIREKLLARLAVPIGYLQIMSSQKTHVSGSEIPRVEVQFVRMLARIQRSLKSSLRRLFDMELLLNGIDPKKNTYEIILSRLISSDRLADAKIMLTYGQAAVYFLEAFGSLPGEVLVDKFLNLSPDYQNIMTDFIKTDYSKIRKARVTQIVNTAKKAGMAPSTGGGFGTKDRLPDVNAGPTSGNNNKSKSKRVTEQKGGPTQTVSLETLVDIFYLMQDDINQDYRDAGILIPELDEMTQRDIISQNLQSIVVEYDDDEELLIV